VCASHCAQLLHTILHRTDLIVFPLTLQTITTSQMMSIWGKGGYLFQNRTFKNKCHKCFESDSLPPDEQCQSRERNKALTPASGMASSFLHPPLHLSEQRRGVGADSPMPVTQKAKNKCSAVAKMGDHLGTIDMSRKLRAVPFFGGGELGPYLTQCGLCWGLAPYQAGILIHPAVRHQQTWAENWGLCPFGGVAGSPSNTMWPGLRPTSELSFILIHPTDWPQYTNWQTDRQTGQMSNSIRRTVLQTVSQKLMFHASVTLNMYINDHLKHQCYTVVHKTRRVSFQW